jgi:EmrB/QacA subfamily drug resistance transporter
MPTSQPCGAYGSAVEPRPAEPSGQVAYSSGAGRGLLAAVTLGAAMVFLDTTAVNVAVPSIGLDLGASVSQLQWVLTGYTLTLSAFLLLGGALGDRLGRRRVYLVGIVLFASTSVLCALAPTIEWLIVARLGQGVAGAVVTPGSLAIIEATFVRGDRGQAIGLWAGVSGLAPATGPPLGGWLAELDWRLVFVLNVPVAVAAFVLTQRFVPETRDTEVRGPLDWPGAALIALALGSLTLALVSWTDASGSEAGLLAALVAVSLAAALGFVARMRRAVSPMVPPLLVANRTFSLANVITFACYASLAALLFFLVLQLQTTLGFRPLVAGFAILPFPLMVLLLSARAGKLAGTVGPRPLLMAGTAIAAAGTAWLALLGEGDDYVDVLPAILLFGVGFGLLVAPLTATVLAAAPDRLAGTASGVNNTVSYTGELLGVASLPAIVGLSAQDYTDPAALSGGYQVAMLLCAGALAVAAVLAVGIPRTLEDCR